MGYSVRKKNRLTGFDCSMLNAYFITICTLQRKKLLWESVGATIGRPFNIPLSATGKAVQTAIEAISQHYPANVIEHYAIMPNHVHLLLRIQADENGRPMVAPYGFHGRCAAERCCYEASRIRDLAEELS